MSDGLTISIDAMGGDHAPHSVIGGLEKAARQDGRLQFILHGDEAALTPLLQKRRPLRERCEIRHTAGVVEMDAKPSVAVRRGRDTSLWHALDSVRTGEAGAAVSSGNTGAMMAMALFCLRPAKGVDRPAIAALWPTQSESQHCVVLDMGADIRADASDLVTYAIMGAQYARIALGTERPRVSLLNVGIEANKGRSEVRDAAQLLARMHEAGKVGFDYTGFIEANAIPQGHTDVVVTDGFTGNVALKAAEGTARFIGDHLRGTFEASIAGRIAALFALASLRRLKKRIDPRRVNGGVFLGLDGLVVKSHGSADATGFAAAVGLAANMARENFTDRLARDIEGTLEIINAEETEMSMRAGADG